MRPQEHPPYKTLVIVASLLRFAWQFDKQSFHPSEGLLHTFPRCHVKEHFRNSAHRRHFILALCLSGRDSPIPKFHNLIFSHVGIDSPSLSVPHFAVLHAPVLECG
jgi:hypothetical protein